MSSEKKKYKISDIPESYQKYIDEIYSISRNKKGGWVTNKEIAENLDVEPASVSGMLEKLRNEALIKWEPRKAIRLTKKGKQIAKQLTEIHDLLEDFFTNVLKIKDKKAVEDLSCQIEHHITSEVRISLSEFLKKYKNQK
ncbi:MAG: metal-dependent transcriptional regulator [Promethearchaeia archaeon]